MSGGDVVKNCKKTTGNRATFLQPSTDAKCRMPADCYCTARNLTAREHVTSGSCRGNETTPSARGDFQRRQ